MDLDKAAENSEDGQETKTKTIRSSLTGKSSHAKTRTETQQYRKEWEHTPDFKGNSNFNTSSTILDSHKVAADNAEECEEEETKTIRLTPTGKISHAKTRVYTQRYRKEWEHTPDFKDWLTSVPFQATRAFCKFCQRNLHAHRLSLLKHMCTLKHQRAAVQYVKKQEDEDAMKGQQSEDDQSYVVEQVDTDEGDDDYDGSNYIHATDEEEILEYHEEEVVESENENDVVVYKRMRIDQNDGQDALAQAMADVDPDLLDEHNDEIQFEMVNEADHDDDVVEKQFEIVKCESVNARTESATNLIDINNKSISSVKESSPQLSFSMDTDSLADSKMADSKSTSTLENSKKVFFLSSSGKSSFTVLKGKLPQFLLNQSDGNNIIKRDKIETKPATKYVESKSICTFATNSSQELANKSKYSSTLTATTKSILMKKPVVSTYVLETSKGVPVSGLQIILYKLDDGRWKNIHEGYTCANGTYDFSNSARNNLTVGRYRLHYDVEKYYNMKKITTIYPFIEIVFDIKDPGAVYNIPLLMSPYSYSTFKDSPR